MRCARCLPTPQAAERRDDDSLTAAFQAFCAADTEAAAAAAAAAPDAGLPPQRAASAGAWGPRCQIPGCGASLEALRPYNKRAKCVARVPGAPARRQRPAATPTLTSAPCPTAAAAPRRRLCGTHLHADECVLPGGALARFCQVRPRRKRLQRCASLGPRFAADAAAPPARQRCHRLQPLRDFDGAKHTARRSSSRAATLATH